MRILIVTEKNNPELNQRDGGYQLIKTLKEVFPRHDIMQFGNLNNKKKLCFEYPFFHSNRFERRILNADFIQAKIQEISHLYTHVFYIHSSMQFGILQNPLPNNIEVWTFPMFLTPSYEVSGEMVPSTYYCLEKKALSYSNKILTPSLLEKNQLIENYGIHPSKIHMVPRGISGTPLKPAKISEVPVFCSIGSIKTQKNTLGLIRFFSEAKKSHPKAKLKIIGPAQNDALVNPQNMIQN